MIEFIAPREWKKFVWAAVIGAVVFILLQIIPMLSGPDSGISESQGNVIGNEAALQKATEFAAKQFGVNVTDAHTIYQTDSDETGYLIKEKLYEDYASKYMQQFPLDTYQTQVTLNNGSTAFVYLHMQSGSVVAWNLIGAGSDLHSIIDQKQLLDAASSFATTQGFQAKDLNDATVNSLGQVVIHPTGYAAGSSQLELRFGFSQNGENTIISTYKPAFVPPSDYVAIVEQQKNTADVLSLISLTYMTFITLVLAIIYAILYRRHTTFKRGIVISLIFTVFYIINNLGIMDGVIAQQGEQVMSDAEVSFMAWFTAFLLIPVGSAVYFSFVAGDGMWRSWKRPVWPGFREKNYGEHVWRSMGLGYLIALILLGVQSVIFLVLESAIGSWSTSDATQSPYNIKWLWLMPMLAWCAAISEEAIYRFFGIALFRRWFKNIYVAALIPTILWALGHVAYPIFPYYTRLIELIIIGMIFSYIFLRYSLITAIFVHAIFDSLLMGFSLISVGGALNIGAAIFYAVLPVPIAYIIRVWHRKKGGRPPQLTATPPPQVPQ
ncbi:Membrane protease YdiL, CAAX protease family [Paenibacillus algorifonticola]|uniref:Membrane protease YdiL, CAAX protease family n=1 Tax=Paenibacillus algorifonticola TaxID=684063 RepID=A0A1I2BCF7_9BACL|nr:CPBP family intramembrane glutamic endopeptidase [Paenibacillus algorifonticola]SFE53835.1 Membrane protease YdiL, CAAX protease family [Paenibacillus algorifonticola]